MRTALFFTASAAALLSSQVLAQEAPANPEPGAGSEILVTARRVSENLQDVPISIVAFSQESLNERAIANSYDLAKSVPGLVVTAGSGSSALPDFSIRGRGQFFGAASGSVETYFADVPLSPPFQIPTLPPQYFDLSSVQVLKGPQGTLFGRNTTGGAVLFVPQAPTDKFEGYVRAQLGDFANRQFEVALNLPLGDRAALRLAGFAWHRKGYTKTRGGEFDFESGRALPVQDYNNQDVLEFRGTLKLDPTDNFTNSTIFTWHGSRNRGSSQAIAGRAGTALGGAIAGSITGNPRVSTLDTDLSRERSSTWAVINTSVFEFSDAIRLKNILSYINARGYGNNPSDVDGAAIPAINLVRPLRQLRNRQLVEELQLQGSSMDDRLDWIFGGTHDQTRQPGADNKINITTNTFGFGATGKDYDVQFRQSSFTSRSLFGSLTFHASDAFSITAAARNSWDKIADRSVQVNNSSVALSAIPNPATLAPGVVYLDLAGQRKFQGWSYNIGADYELSDDVKIYAGYKRGYKRGGFNGRGGNLANFGPETVNNFFLGMKSAFDVGSGRGSFNIEGFWDTYQDAQRSYLELSGGALVTTIENVPKSRYRGFDVDFSIAPTDWLRLSGNYTFVDSKYIRYPDTTVPAALALLPPAFQPTFLLTHPIVNNALAVNPLAFVNRHKLNLQARFQHELSSGVELALTPSVSYQSKYYFNDGSKRIQAVGEVLFNGAQPVNAFADGANQSPGYALVDIRAEANNLLGRDVSFAAGVTNLFDKKYIQGGGGIWSFGLNAVSFGPPRMVYGEVTFRF
jgi:iron complex outermembrane receptor protein